MKISNANKTCDAQAAADDLTEQHSAQRAKQLQAQFRSRALSSTTYLRRVSSDSEHFSWKKDYSTQTIIDAVRAKQQQASFAASGQKNNKMSDAAE